MNNLKYRAYERLYKIIEELGWIKPFEHIDLWYRIDDELYTAIFPTEELFLYFPSEEYFTIESVKRFLSTLPHTKFKKESLDWVLRVLASDYFYWRRDYASELTWAKMAMTLNNKLEKETFSKQIQDKL